jgi:hypothetical protein
VLINSSKDILAINIKNSTYLMQLLGDVIVAVSAQLSIRVCKDSKKNWFNFLFLRFK